MKSDQSNESSNTAISMEELTHALIKFPIETVAGWHCKLNIYQWPDDFPMSKPDGFDEMNRNQKFDLPAMKIAFDAVSAVVPRKEQLRAWHKGGYFGEPKTDAQFETWWKSDSKEDSGPHNHP